MNAAVERPLPPEEPDPLDCCGEGCVRCIYDVYDDAISEYREALAMWQSKYLVPGDGSPPD